MASQRGGYQQPSNPSPTPMPGAMSNRTDGGPADTQPSRSLPNAKYGEGKAFNEIEGGAPVAGSPQQSQALVPLGAKSQRPDEPVSAGSPMGDGVGPDAAGIESRTMDQQDAQSLEPMLPLLKFMANQPDASPSTRAFVRRVQGNL